MADALIQQLGAPPFRWGSRQFLFDDPAISHMEIGNDQQPGCSSSNAQVASNQPG